MINDRMVKKTTKLLSWLRAWDEQTYQHSLRTAGYAFRIASQMHMAWQDRRDLLVAAMLHDIGKRAIPKQILRKSTRLTDEEYKLIRKHAEIGSYILQVYGFPDAIRDAVRDHHEQPDGNGYRRCAHPARYADIIRVADCLDVMFAGRSYQKPKTKEQMEEDLRKKCRKEHGEASRRRGAPRLFHAGCPRITDKLRKDRCGGLFFDQKVLSAKDRFRKHRTY